MLTLKVQETIFFPLFLLTLMRMGQIRLDCFYKKNGSFHCPYRPGAPKFCASEICLLVNYRGMGRQILAPFLNDSVVSCRSSNLSKSLIYQK